MLLDPTRDDPWAHLYLDHVTGVITERAIADGSVSRLGAGTLRIVSVLREEALIEGRLRTIEHLKSAVQGAADSPGDNEARIQLARTVREDELGLAAWFAFWEGAEAEPFVSLRSDVLAWDLFVRLAVAQTYGR